MATALADAKRIAEGLDRPTMHIAYTYFLLSFMKLVPMVSAILCAMQSHCATSLRAPFSLMLRQMAERSQVKRRAKTGEKIINLI